MAVRKVLCKNAASRSGLPGLDWALNPYRGCSHACSYCYAQDVTRFEMGRAWGENVEVKVNFVEMLRKQLEKGPEGTFGLGTVTDPYQGVEKQFELSRGCLKELKRFGSSVSVLTKSDLVLRDLEILSGWPGAEVGVSIGTANEEMASLLEPGAPSPGRRFATLRKLSEAGIDTYLMAAPIVRGVGDCDEALRKLVRLSSESGVKRIMWDKFNPKPIAGARLKAALARRSIELVRVDDGWVESVRRTMQRECGDAGIELLDAF